VGNPRQATRAFGRSRALDRRFHRSAGPAASATGPAAGIPQQAAPGLCPSCQHAAANGGVQ
jgi:hypothetical protein